MLPAVGARIAAVKTVSFSVSVIGPSAKARTLLRLSSNSMVGSWKFPFAAVKNTIELVYHSQPSLARAVKYKKLWEWGWFLADFARQKHPHSPLF